MATNVKGTAASDPVSGENERPPFSHTKVVATIGPASEDRIDELLDAGMSVARLNFSHGTPEEHRRRVEKLRAIADAKMVSLGILVDIPGPKVRLGCFPDGRVSLKRGDIVRVRQGSGVAEAGEVRVDYEGFLESVRSGHRIFLGDGQVELVTKENDGESRVARVGRGGIGGDGRGVHMPDSDIRYELPTAEDRELLKLARELGVDMVGVSFVSRAAELREVRSIFPEAAIVAKIERALALENLDEILAEADGIMVARGDLGVELELEQVPLAQKRLIQAALKEGRFTITATEMLESMVGSSRPTRAEVADVANAVLDGTDAIMLSAETAVGQYPVEAVATMNRIAHVVEQSQRYHDLPKVGFRGAEATFGNATAMAAVQAQEALGLSKIVVFTETGNTARLLSRYRPSAEIIALSPNPATVNHMTVLSSVRPILFRREPSIEDMLYMASEMLVVRGLADYGTELVFVAGVPPGVAKSTNVMKLHRIGEEVRMH